MSAPLLTPTLVARTWLWLAAALVLTGDPASAAPICLALADRFTRSARVENRLRIFEGLRAPQRVGGISG